MSIMDMFRTNPPAARQEPTLTPANIAGNATVPSDANKTQDGKSPVANFDKLWEKDPAGTPASPTLVPAARLDPNKLKEAAGKLDFTAHISKDLVTKAMAGDMDSFLSVINQSAQLGFAQATAAAGEINNQSLSQAQSALTEKVLPDALRQQQISQAMAAKNPIMNDPAVAPMLNVMKQQFASKYPTATPDEIAGLASQYLQDMGAKITGVSAPAQGVSPRAERVETDWGAFFEGA